MAILKCKMCGGALTIEDESTVCECEYCGTKQTVPKADDEKKITLFERANRLRFNCEFDKAASVYESIVAEFREEAEGYWGLVLCKYGIEYVDDPATGNKVPTCHRSSFDSVMDDADFELVMENADGISRQVYREQAKQIEEIRKGIIEVSGKEQPYDIFICYKETAEDGQRTLDSVLAQDVYEALTDKGYRVFFSRITLEDKLGTEYEPYIFAALNSAKIMLAFGTTYDYYNAVWVKNEWSRYLKLMAADKTKHLIPCFKDIDAYDIPKEFARLQAQDLGKVGAVQDLIRGIDKILNPEGREGKPAPQAAVNTDEISAAIASAVSANVGSNTRALLDRGFLTLEDREWDAAQGFFEEALNQDAKCAEAYLGKLMADEKVAAKENLRDVAEPFEENKNYQKLIRFADQALAAEVQGYVDYIKERNETARKQGIYDNAMSQMQQKEYEKAAELFGSIAGFQDAEAKAAECRTLASEASQQREKLVDDIAQAIRDKMNAIQMEDTEKQLEDCRAKITKLEGEIRSEEEAQKKLSAVISEWERLKGEKERAEHKVSELTNEKASLGIFAGKRKKEIDDALFEQNEAIKRLNGEIYAKKAQTKGLTVQSLNEAVEKLRSSLQAEQARQVELTTRPEQEKITGTARISYEEAIKLLRDKKIAEKCRKKYPERAVFCSSKGDIVNFGNNEKASEWLVLDSDGSKRLLLSRNAICNRQYHHKWEKITWEKCTLRAWLNNTYLTQAFNVAEQRMIQTTKLKNADNEEYGTSGGNDTQDKVFLLSMDEIKKYFTEKLIVDEEDEEDEGCSVYIDPAGQCEITDTAGEAVWWWLRSPGGRSDYAAFVHSDGSVSADGDGVDLGDFAVRPALWIDISSL